MATATPWKWIPEMDKTKKSRVQKLSVVHLMPTSVLDEDDKEIFTTKLHATNMLREMEACQQSLLFISAIFAAHNSFACDVTHNCQCKVFFNEAIWNSEYVPLGNNLEGWKNLAERFEKYLDTSFYCENGLTYADLLSQFTTLMAHATEAQAAHYHATNGLTPQGKIHLFPLQVMTNSRSDIHTYSTMIPQHTDPEECIYLEESIRVKVNFEDHKRNPDLYPWRSVEVYNPTQNFRGITPPTATVANEPREQADELNAAPIAEGPITEKAKPIAVPAVNVESMEPPTKRVAIDLTRLKVAELKTELAARGLCTKGVKSALVVRLKESLDWEQEGQDEPDVAMNELSLNDENTAEPAVEVVEQATETSAMRLTPPIELLSEIKYDEAEEMTEEWERPKRENEWHGHWQEFQEATQEEEVLSNEPVPPAPDDRTRATNFLTNLFSQLRKNN